MADGASHGPIGSMDRRYVRRLAEVPPNDDGPLWTLRLLAYDIDDTHDARDAGHREEAERLAADLFGSIGAHDVFCGDVVDQLEASPRWHRVAMVKYPTRRSLVDLHSGDDYRRLRQLETVDLSHSIVLGCIPTPAVPVPHGVALPKWSEVPHPANDDDSPIVVLHLERYAACDWSPDDMASYANVLAKVSIPHGARSTRAFAVEGVVFGDGRSWDEVRFTMYPSAAAFTAVVNDLAHIDAFERHRRHVIADTHTLVLRPTIDRILRSLSD